jgi:hypothetical protein
MLKAMLRLLACATVLIIVAACDTQFSAMPNPVVIKDGVYWFPLGGRLFAVPEKYVTRYGRNSTDGSLHAFSLHALLPDFEGRTPENKAKFGGRGWGDRIEMTVTVGGMSANEREKKNHEIYVMHKKEYGSEVVSKIPHIEKISEKLSDRFYLIEDARVKKEIKCSKGAVSDDCKTISLPYRDNVYIWITYSRAYEQDWINIHDQVIVFLESFERPLDAFPTQP